MGKEKRQLGREDVIQRVLKERSPFDLQEFSQQVGVTVDVVKHVIDSLKEQGYTFEKSDSYVLRGKNPNEQTIFDARKYLDNINLHFGLISDTHMSSVKERLDSLHAMYDRFQKEGVRLVLHVGDITDGVGVFRGHEFELKHQGQTAQINHVTANYPKREGITTAFITGNHDLRATERGGVDPGVPISQARPDLIYLGQMAAEVKLADNVRMDLLHPAGGTAYALSYKAQRMINNMNPKDIPDVMAHGHYHTSFYMRYRNIDFLQVPSFKDDGQFEKRLGLNSTIGGWLVDAQIGEGGKITRFQPELHTWDNLKR